MLAGRLPRGRDGQIGARYPSGQAGCRRIDGGRGGRAWPVRPGAPRTGTARRGRGRRPGRPGCRPPGRRPGRCGAGWHRATRCRIPGNAAGRSAGIGLGCGFAGLGLACGTVGSRVACGTVVWGWSASTGVTVAVPRAGRTVPVTTASVGWTGSGSAGTVPNASQGPVVSMLRVALLSSVGSNPDVGRPRPGRTGIGQRPGGPASTSGRAGSVSTTAGSGRSAAVRRCRAHRVCRSSRAAPAREAPLGWRSGWSRDGSAARATGAPWRPVVAQARAEPGSSRLAVTPPPAVAASSTVQPCRRASRPTTNRPSTSVGARSSRSRRVNRAFSSASRSGRSCPMPWSTTASRDTARRLGSAVTTTRVSAGRTRWRSPSARPAAAPGR